MPGLVEYPMDKPGALDEAMSNEQTERRKQIDAAWAYYGATTGGR